MNLHGTVVRTQVLCVNTKMEQIGIEDDMYLDFAFDLSAVTCMKEADTEGETTSVYVGTDHFIIPEKFQDVFELWIEILSLS